MGQKRTAMGHEPGAGQGAEPSAPPVGRRPRHRSWAVIVVLVALVVVAGVTASVLLTRDDDGLDSPEGLAVDITGNLYIADSANHRVLRVDRAGRIATVAGTGDAGYSSDGGPATEAKLAFPVGLAVDAVGNLYIGDVGNHRVRRVDPAGVITTVAGTGVRGFSGDGGLATAAKLDLVHRGKLAVDTAGNLYIAHYGDRIRRVDRAGIITTIARLDDPDGLAVDLAGNLYVSVGLDEVVRLDPAGEVTRMVGGGSETSEKLSFPEGLAVDAAGNLYVADTGNDRVLRRDPRGVIITVAGEKPYRPGSSSVQRGPQVSPTSEAEGGAARRGDFGDGGPATSAELASLLVSPFTGLAVDADGNLYIADVGNRRVRRVDPSGIITTVAR
jgi:sugar lactone lactonase YvrE